MVHPSANCIFISTVMHKICFTLKENMNLERAQKIYSCISINYFLVPDAEGDFRIA